MSLTLQAVEAHIRNALGGDSSVEGNGRVIANQAGRYLTTMHDWRFMERVGRLSLRGTISITSATYFEAGYLLLAPTAIFANYVWLEGDEVEITSGTGATLGIYRVRARVSTQTIALYTSIGSGADNQTDIVGSMELPSCALPDDFRQLVGTPWAVGSTVQMRMLGSMDDLMFLRSGTSVQGGLAYCGAISWYRSTITEGGAPIPRIDIDPAPTTDDNNAFVFQYRADWPDVDDDEYTIPVPPTFAIEMLYLQIVRAVALGYEEFDQASMDDRLAAIVGGPIYSAAVVADGGIQPSVGPMRGGAAAMYHSDNSSGDGWHGNDITVDWP